MSVKTSSIACRYTDTVTLFQALGGGWWNRTDAGALHADAHQRGQPSLLTAQQSYQQARICRRSGPGTVCLVFADGDTILSAFGRNTYNQANAMLQSPASFADLNNALKANPALHLKVQHEARSLSSTRSSSTAC